MSALGGGEALRHNRVGTLAGSDVDAEGRCPIGLMVLSAVTVFIHFSGACLLVASVFLVPRPVSSSIENLSWEEAFSLLSGSRSIWSVRRVLSDRYDWASKGVPNSIMLAEPFAPAQLITAISQLLNTDPPQQ
jgi:hypothetical protein